MKNNPHQDLALAKMINTVLILVGIVLIALAGFSGVIIIGPQQILTWMNSKEPERISTIKQVTISPDVWHAPDATQLPPDETGKLIAYGRELIVHTSQYFGPNGTIKPISNGMNCQNCHLDAGTKPFGNNYSAVASTYPKFRPRSGTNESIEKRVNDCFERSLNGQPLADKSHEMRAIVAYIKWLGKDVAKGIAPKGSGLVELPLLDRPASIENGKLVYEQKCALCHGKGGAGVAMADGSGYQFPPLWGKQSYNVGAGLYRLSRFAGYVKANMPLGATFENPQLTDEEAWDVAAFVNSLPRPTRDLSNDWPDISKKPFDHPFGPYTDGFNETQHKLGPFKPIQEKRKVLSSAK
jgi:thiosulfate dehydrogenase